MKKIQQKTTTKKQNKNNTKNTHQQQQQKTTTIIIIIIINTPFKQPKCDTIKVVLVNNGFRSSFKQNV